jgi:hypothetical protein
MSKQFILDLDLENYSNTDNTIMGTGSESATLTTNFKKPYFYLQTENSFPKKVNLKNDGDKPGFFIFEVRPGKTYELVDELNISNVPNVQQNKGGVDIKNVLIFVLFLVILYLFFKK